MGERMQSLKSSCLLFSFFKWTEKDDGEWLKVYAISISFTCPWNEMENMVSTPVALVLLIFQAEDSPQCSSPRAKMKNVPQKLLFDLKRLSWAWSNLGYACIPCGVIPRSLFCPAAPQGLNMHMCTNTHTHTHTHMEPKEWHNLLLAFWKNNLKLRQGDKGLKKMYWLKKMRNRMTLSKKKEKTRHTNFSGSSIKRKPRKQ